MAKTMVRAAKKAPEKATKKAAKKTTTKTAKKVAKKTTKTAKKAAKKTTTKKVASKTASGAAWPREDRLVHIDTLMGSPLNPRHIPPPEMRIRELADSILRVGVLDRLIVRANGTGGYEVLAGSSRRRAIELAVSEGADPMVPVTILDVPDDVALELAITSNDQRYDPHPLDQCAAFARLRDQFGRSVQQIAARVGRTPSYVYDRLRLESLSEVARQALIEDRITTTVAVILARCASPRAQDQATTDLLRRWEREGAVPVWAAREAVRERLMVIADAPFNATDGCYPGGSCEGCDRRSDAERQQLAFGDLLVEDDPEARCLDLDCWDIKVEHHWRTVADEARRAGKRVATPEEQSAIAPRTYGPLAGGYVYLDHLAYNGRDGTWREQLGDRIALVDITVIRDEGRPVEVAKRAEIEKILNPSDDGGETDDDESGRDPSSPEAPRKSEARETMDAQRRKVADALLGSEVSELVALRALGVLAILTIDGDILEQLGGTSMTLAERFEVDVDDETAIAEARRLTAEMSLRQTVALVTDQLLQWAPHEAYEGFMAELGIQEPSSDQ